MHLLLNYFSTVGFGSACYLTIGTLILIGDWGMELYIFKS